MSAVTFTTGIALAPRVAKAARARRNVAVAAKCVSASIVRSKSRAALVAKTHPPRAMPRRPPPAARRPTSPSDPPGRVRRATPEAPAVVTKDVKRGLTLAAGVTSASALAAGSAMANDVLFQVAEFDGTGVIDEETALYALVGGSLAICTAVLSLVIGSDLFIKNIVNK
eukprot:31156-Pelagococcus_subviridis.AAC.13